MASRARRASLSPSASLVRAYPERPVSSMHAKVSRTHVVPAVARAGVDCAHSAASQRQGLPQELQDHAGFL